MSDPTDLPPEVARLVAARAERRSARDWAAADEIRDSLAGLGWQVVDTPDGPRVDRTAAPRPVTYARADEVPSRLDEPPTGDATLVVVAEDHPDDLERLIAALWRHRPDARGVTLVVVANAPTFDPTPILDRRWPDAATREVIAAEPRVGWAEAHNMGLRRVDGRGAICLDGSVEPLGDIVEPLLAALGRQGVGIAGAWGLTSADARHFAEAPAGEVDAIEGYCMGLRREVLSAVGLFDPWFRFYRHADLELSFRARAAGWRAVAVADLPLRRHEHRAWAALSTDERERLSRRNFYRFLKRWGDRRDLLLHPAPLPVPAEAIEADR